MNIIGMDIGTTTICGVLFSTDKMEILKTIRVNNAFIPESEKIDAVEDPELILQKFQKIADELIDFSDESVAAISVSSQMHGILYVDENGKAVTPLYTWQNQRGLKIEKSLSETLGYPVHTGYGLVTHLSIEHPEEARRFCSIGDYVLMRLSGITVPVTDRTMSASFGIFDVERAEYTDKVDSSFFPELSDKPSVIGNYRAVPVVTVIGDNQASFLGAVRSLEGTLLLNYGTGGQISYFSREYISVPGFEVRPMGDEGYLNAAFSLTGGDSYAILASFFSKILNAFGYERNDIYKVMDSFEIPQDEPEMKCETTFLGSRDKDSSYASFTSVTKANFTPEAMTHALIEGMGEELHGFYERIPSEMKSRIRILCGAGNGIRKNERLQKVAERLYSCPIVFSSFEEEGAVGAVMNAGVGIGLWKNYKDAVDKVHSKE